MVTAICSNLITPLQFSSSVASVSTRNLHTDCFNQTPPLKNISFRQKSGRKSLSRSRISRGLSVRNFSVVCGVPAINQNEFPEEVLRSDLPVLVEFVADWCGPCRLISPAMDWASQEYKERLKIVKIDHDSNPQLIEEYKVFGLPALILFKNGKEVPESRREGAMTKIKLKEYLDTLLESVAVT